MHTLHGVIPALVTPRNDASDDVDAERLADLTRWLLGTGIHGIFPTSSTGEAPSLSPGQRRRAIETVVDVVTGQVPVLAGAGAASTAASIRLARDAEAAGATHLALLPLHFAPLSAEELYGYFAAVADGVGLPVVLYNYPARTGGQNIPTDVAARLARTHNVVGIKDSSGDLTNTLGYVRDCGPEFAVLVGAESQIYPCLMMGGAGTVCSAANVVPERIVALYEAFQQGNMAEARRQQEVLLRFGRVFQVGTFPAGVKAAMALIGQPVGEPFPPVRALSTAQQEELRACLGALNALPA